MIILIKIKMKKSIKFKSRRFKTGGIRTKS